MIKLKPEAKPVFDPVCGMQVYFHLKKPSIFHSGHTYFFCAENCREAFKKDPEMYLQKKQARRKGIWGRYLERLNKATGGKSQRCH